LFVIYDRYIQTGVIMRLITLIISAVLTTMLFACGGGDVKKSSVVVATQIYSGFHCGSSSGQASVEWIADQMLLEGTFGKLSKQFATTGTAAPKVDFSNQRVVLVYMGQRPTAGYGLRLASDKFRTYKQTAEVTLEWLKPGKGMVTAQVITNPCVVLTIPRAGYERLQIVDMGGDVRLRMEVGE
jgi:hypothetical protein